MPAWLQRDWCSSFVLALGHFLWQGVLIAVVLAIALRFTKKVSVRYWLSLAALLVMAACPIVTLGWLMQPVSHVAMLDPPPIVRGEPAAMPPTITFAPAEEASDVGHVSNVSPMVTLDASTSENLRPVDVLGEQRHVVNVPHAWWQKFAPQLTTAYLCGVGLMLLRLVIGLWGGRRLRRRVHLIDDSSLLNAMQRQATALGLKLLPVLAYCERVTVPTVVGVLKPMILLPLTLTSGLSPEQIESVLAHELAHLRRCDQLVNLLQRVIESLLFFHPAVWWVSHRIREEREHCCDDLVVACGAMPLDYAKSLLRVAELSRASKLRRSVAAVSLLATGDKPSSLRQRIARLLGESATPSLRISPRVLLLSICIPLIAVIATIQSGASNQQPSRSDKDEQSQATEFSTKLRNGVTVKLVGVGFHPSEKREWWQADGSPLDQRPYEKIAGNPLFQDESRLADCREFVLEIRGLPDDHFVMTRVEGLLKSRGAILNERKDGVFILKMKAGQFADQKTTSLVVGLSVDPLGPAQGIGSDGRKLPAVDVPQDAKLLYDLFQPLRVQSQDGGTVLVLKSLARFQLDQKADWRLVAIDSDGQETTSNSQSESAQELELSFKLPLARLAHFEYRLRPLRHWVTFENVSLLPGQQTEVKVKVESVPDEKPKRENFSAKLPNGLSVELVGLTKNTAPAKDGWKPDGLPIGDVGYWPATIYKSGNTTGSFVENGEHPEPNAGAFDLLFRFRGLKNQPSFAFDLAANGVSYVHRPVKDPYEFRVTAERRSPPPGAKWTIPDGEMRVGLTDEPWGRYVKISPEGKVLDPVQPDEQHASTYNLIEVLGTQPHDRAPTGNTVVLRLPLTNADSPTNDEGSLDLRHRFAFEFRAIDTEGKLLWATEWQRQNISETKRKESQWGLAEPLPAGKTLSHYEYRLRPYRHWVTFENVSLQPGQKTDVKVSFLSLPQEKRNPEKYVATLPSGAEVELAGLAFVNVAYADGTKRRKDDAWWQADGTKLDAPPFKPYKSWTHEDYAHFREVYFRLKPPRKDSPITVTQIAASPSPHPVSHFGGGWDPDEAGLSFMKFEYTAGFKEEKPVAVHVFVSDQPFGPAWQIDLDGKPMPSKDVDATTQALRRLINLGRVEKTTLEPKIDYQTVLRLELPPDHTQQMDFQIVAVSKQGQSLSPNGRLSGSDGDGFTFKSPVADLSHFEIKLRPTTHKVTFDNVSLVPGQATEVTVKVESVELLALNGLEFLKPYPKLHGLSLDMTEPQFLEIVKQQELKTRKTVEGEKVTHRITLGDGHSLIVMFDKDAKCSGIQRVRGEDDEKPAEPVMLIQLNPPPVVGDFSKVDDPDVLLDQLAKSQLPSLEPQTGGGFFHHTGTPPQAMYVTIWENQYAGNDKLDPRIRRLIELEDRAVPRVHQRLSGLAASDLLAAHLTLVLRSAGATESVPVLIKLMKTAPTAPIDGTQNIDGFLKSHQASVTQIAVTSALWKLTDRKHVFTPDQWEKWWKSVKPDFVVPSERKRPEFVSRVTPERVNALVKELETNEVAARERLISLGPAALPHLLKVLGVAESLRDSESASRSDAATMRLVAWVIDELGATDKLSTKLRRDYFTRRFSDDDTFAGMYPIDEDALCRALSHCSFTDYCSIYLEAESQGNIAAHMKHLKWPMELYSAYCRRFSKIVPRDTGGRTDVPHWRKVVPAEDPAGEIAGAVPILVAALKDERVERRAAASKLAAAIGFCSTAKPETLIVALRDAWLVEADEKVRPEFAFAMCRFGTPFVVKEVSQGLLSDRLEIVSDCAGLMDWIPIQLNDETRAAFERLVELTRHENDRVRRSATRSLAYKAPELLGPEFERLCTDKVKDIRESCTLALRSNPDPKHADILFKLADDAEQTIRESAFSSIANLNHPPSMKRLLPHLRDKKVHGYAVSALASMGGQDALPLMMSELESGNDVGGMVYQHLRRLTGETFEEKPEPWLAWWKKKKSTAALRSNRPNELTPVQPETNADPFGTPSTSAESGYPVIKHLADELLDGWIACEFGLQYRVRAETISLVAGELPLLVVDVRNRGTFKDMGLELHQSQHVVVVGGNRYERRDQPWAGVAPLEPEGKPLTLVFALSDDWKREGETKTPLRLAQGKHSIALSLMIAPVYPSSDEPQATPAPRKPIARSLVCRPIEIEIRSRAWSGPPGSLGLENIRREVLAIPDFHSPKVPANLQRLVQEHQQAAGDFLVKLIKSDDPGVQQAASVVFADAWDSMKREQIESYLHATMTHFVWQRPQYPQGIDARIGMGPRFRPEYLGLPPDRKYSAETITTLHLDGQQFGQPYTYPGFGSLSHWLKTKDLSLGRHTFRLATKFKFTRGTETYRGEYESPEFSFEMVPAETPDDLIAPPDKQLDRLVRESLVFAETEYELTHPRGSEHLHKLEPKVTEIEKWSPQIRWGNNTLGLSSLHCPVWKLAKRLPVDLCFSVEFRVTSTDTVIPCNDLVSLTVDLGRQGYFSTFDISSVAAEFSKHADKEGFVRGRLVLKPSRSAALTEAKVKRYYGGEITSQPVRFKISIVPPPNVPAKNPPPEKEKFTFPYFLPDSRIVVGEDLVDEANALGSKEEQIQFLLKILPPSDQKEKRLSDRQVYAMRLLSLTDSDVVIDPLLDRLDFKHKGDGWPASHALGRLGERSVKPVVKKMESVADDLQKAIMLGNALIEIKQKKYPLFLEELRQRKDNKLPDKLLNQLLEVYQLAPND